MVDPNATDDTAPIAFPQELGTVVEGLRLARLDWRTAHARNDERGSYFPSRQALKRITRELSTALFPLRLGPSEITAANENAFIAASLESTLAQLAAQIGLELGYRDGDIDSPEVAARTDGVIAAFAASLPHLRRLLDSDVEAAYAADPAARSVDEVLVAYPSFIAIIYHRVAHRLYRLGAPLVARLIAEIAHADTGIDIHPAAQIGGRFFIDHGTGVVIGETAVIGERVRLYQGVTLGGDPDLSEDKSDKPRHPTVEDDVVIYANASIVGRVTIGARSRVGGNVWLRQDVPADTLVEAPAPIFRPLTNREAGA